MKTFAMAVVLTLCLTLAGVLAFAGPTTAPAKLKPAVGDSAPVVAAPRDNDKGWMAMHDRLVKDAQNQKDAQLIFVGDSITDFWRDKPSFKENYGKYDALDLGISGDRTQHVLWRLDNGEIDGLHPKVAVVMIGTNNVTVNKPVSVAAGVQLIVDTIHEKLPGTKVLLLAIFPREEKISRHRKANDFTNEIIAGLADDGTRFLDISKAFEDENGEIPKDVMADGLHPTAKGYDLWAKAMQPVLDEMMNGK